MITHRAGFFYWIFRVRTQLREYRVFIDKNIELFYGLP